MKKEKKTSKTENRFKSKFESFRKTSANSAFEKARAFFRSLDFKHHHRHEQPNQDNTITITDPPSSNDDDQKQDLLLKSIPSITNISITRIPRVEKTNSQDIIINNDNKLSSNYFQQKYKQYLKPSLLIPKQYYNDILNKRYQTYSTFINRYDLYPRSRISTLNPYSTANNEAPPVHFQPFMCHEIESSRYNEQYDQVRPSLSMLTWNQCVRRLNTEYRLTIDALQQAKECLEQVYSNSKSIRTYKDLSNNGKKRISNVTFCLPLQNQILPSLEFSKPKLIKPVELDTFIPSTKLEPILSIVENDDEKSDSIANIIKKFNDLSNSINKEQSSNENSLQEEETTYTVETFYKNTDDNKNAQEIVVIQENTTEEQFNLVQQEINITPPVLVNTKNKNSISHIPKLIPTTNVSRLKQPSKISKIKPPSSTIVNSIRDNNIQNQRNIQSSSNTKKQPITSPNRSTYSIKPDPTSSNRVKSIVHQINTTASSRSSIPNKQRPSRSIYTNKNPVQRK